MTNHTVVAAHGHRACQFAIMFALTLAGFVLAVDGVVLWLFGGEGATSGNLKFVLFLASFILVCGLFQIYRLSGDGAKVARVLGGVPVALEPGDPALRQFRNVATETAIAAGIPMPKLFVLEAESRINAFAAGTKPDETAVCVSSGALNNLTRAELQGVIAHEMSHLRHEDVGLSRLLAAGVFALMCFTLLGMGLASLAAMSGKSRSKEGAGVALMLILVGLGMMLVGGIGSLAASVLDAATSREMELRADADAARMLSDSSGLVGALVKLGQQANEIPKGLNLDRRMSAANPMFFGVAAKRYWFDTHPPLLERIRALDPAKAAELATLIGG